MAATHKKVEELQAALEEYRRFAIEQIIDEIAERLDEPDQPPPEQVLAALQRHAAFPLMVKIGDLYRRRHPSPETLRRYTQALIDIGRPTAGLQALEEMSKLQPSPKEQREMFGLRGRAYKQLYINAEPNSVAPRTDDLEQALQYYGFPFNGDPQHPSWQSDNPPTWHGINVIALLHHAHVTSGALSSEYKERRDELASVVLHAALYNLASDPPWGYATAMEACIPFVDRHDDAVQFLTQYVDHEKCDRFAVQGTLRQLRELWQLDLKHPLGRRLIPALQNKLAEFPGSGQDLFVDGQEAIYAASYQPYVLLRRGIEAARAVGRIGPVKEVGRGTGFLVSPRHVLTAWHAVRDQFTAQNSCIIFTALDTELVRRFSRLCWTGNDRLDVTLIELAEPIDGVAVLPLNVDPTQYPNPDAGMERAYLIGHPHGGSLAVSLHNSKLVALNERVIQYRSPSNPGSSGCPVFDQYWNAVGVHRAGHSLVEHAETGKPVEANEAVRIDAVWEQIKRFLN